MQPDVLVLSPLPVDTSGVEIVERKGRGHPDTVADALSEAFSRALCNHYLDRFGTILHHNVDKLLIAAGAAHPAFGGGEILAPFDIYLAGRAAMSHRGIAIPVDEIAHRTVGGWLESNFHALDVPAGARVHCVVRPGAGELVELFARVGTNKVPLANDTSIGAAYAPLSATEKLVLAAERHLTSPGSIAAHPARGEDVKVMAVRHGGDIQLTIACAMIGKYLDGIDAYVDAKRKIEQEIRALPEAGAAGKVRIDVNAADDIAAGSIYLTVTGLSAEAGDDGQTGRGNRANGLIAPLRPTSLEALAGKNPVSHVGKLYNITAQRICENAVGQLGEVSAAHCAMVSRIGTPIDRPSLVSLRLALRDGSSPQAVRDPVAQIVADQLAGITGLARQFAAGAISIY